MNQDIKDYHSKLSVEDQKICNKLYEVISKHLNFTENKVWHAHPVWFINGNPIVGYHRLKDNVRLMFWSGQGFKHSGLAKEGSFKAAEIRFNDVSEINEENLIEWLKESEKVQYDYKNIIKNKGLLEKLTV